MNTSQYMDKQIMDLSNSQSNNNNDFINLMENDNGKKEEKIMPSYDFQPLRPNSSPPLSRSDSAGGARVWTSADSKINSGVRNYGSLDSTEPGKTIFEKDRTVYDAALLSEIDQTMKKHADNLLHVLEGVSARLSRLEGRTRHMENSLDDLKVSVGNNHGSTDGKMRQLENILREVETGVLDVKDKQEILEAQLQLAKLQVPKVAQQQPETQSTMHMDPVQQAASAPLQSHHQLPSVALPQPPPTHSPNPLPPQQNLQPSSLLPNQFSQNQIPPSPQRDQYFPPSGQAPETPNQQYQLPPQQSMQAPPPHQQYQPSPVPQYPQAPPPPQQHPSFSAITVPQSQTQPPLGHHPEETTYIPSQNFQPTTHQPPSGAPPSQQFYGTPSQMYEPPSNRPGPGYPASYGPSSLPSEAYPYNGPPSQYGRGAPMKSQQLQSSPSIGSSAGNAYPQIPTARILPHALPTASGVGGGSSSAGSGNKVPIDDVVDKVTNMGFPRDQVRATVRRLTENGQSVDLNMVLDKLMNDGEVQPPRGWFNR